MDADAISACISEKIGEGWDQDRAIAACLSMAESGDLKTSGPEMETKALKFEDAEVDLDERMFRGYASTFGNRDEVGDIIESGAFRKTIKERGPKGSNQIKVLWQHNEPLGIPIKMEEDEKGLYVEGKISKTRLGDEALELMRDGVVDKMSIGFSIPNGKAYWDDEDQVRRIKEVKLFEFSPVTFPANEMASITAVKSIEGLLAKTNLSEDDFCKLRSIYRQIDALLKNEPPKGTPTDEPLMDPELIESIKSLSDFAKTRLY